MRSFPVCLVVFTVVLNLPAGWAVAEQEHKGHQGSQLAAKVAVVFSTRDRQAIQQYYRTNTSNLPPGLAKRGGNLPPGLEKHLERNGTLPPGLQKRVEPFPEELDRRLPRLPEGYSRVLLSGRALILDRQHKIIDVLVVVGGGGGYVEGRVEEGHGNHHGRGHDENEDEHHDER